MYIYCTDAGFATDFRVLSICVSYHLLSVKRVMIAWQYFEIEPNKSNRKKISAVEKYFIILPFTARAVRVTLPSKMYFRQRISLL
jgi:hypothetical protein